MSALRVVRGTPHWVPGANVIQDHRRPLGGFGISVVSVLRFSDGAAYGCLDVVHPERIQGNPKELARNCLRT